MKRKFSEIDLGVSLTGEELYKILTNSAWMKHRGYEMEGTTKYADGSSVDDVVNWQSTGFEKQGEPTGHYVMYKHPTEYTYIHIPEIGHSEPTTVLKYWVTTGLDKSSIRDLKGLVFEIRHKKS